VRVSSKEREGEYKGDDNTGWIEIGGFLGDKEGSFILNYSLRD
jgi:hypothetical protein